MEDSARHFLEEYSKFWFLIVRLVNFSEGGSTMVPRRIRWRARGWIRTWLPSKCRTRSTCRSSPSRQPKIFCLQFSTNSITFLFLSEITFNIGFCIQGLHLSVFEEYGPHEDPGKASERVTRVARCALLLCDNLKCLNYGIEENVSPTNNKSDHSYVVQYGANIDECK